MHAFLYISLLFIQSLITLREKFFKGSYYALLQSPYFVLGEYRSCSHAWYYFSHNVHYYNTFLPSLTQTT